MVAPAPARPPDPVRPWLLRFTGVLIGVGLATLAADALGDGLAAIAVGAVAVIAGVVVIVRMLVRRHWPARVPPPASDVPVVRPVPSPAPRPWRDLDRGVSAVRRMDPGFDPTRFVGWATMVFRDVQTACMTRNPGSLRDRLTPEMFRELCGLCERLRATGRSSQVGEIDIGAEVTEVWQDGDRDYLTAYIAGSMLSWTIADATGELLDGSSAIPARVEVFLTFTRPAGLNFWMLSVIQPA